jgi:pyridoxamine 5'-phosphate oxidase
LNDAESDTYFAARPRGSQLAAWASRQSKPLADRKMLAARMQAFEAQYENKPVPRPPYWGGYQLVPLRIEFWQEREFRLHDRIVYHRKDGAAAWIIEKLYP